MKEKEKLNAYKIAYGINRERKCTGHSAPPLFWPFPMLHERGGILTCNQKPTRVSLIYRTEPTTKKVENRRTEKLTKTAKCSEVSVNGLVNPEKKNLEKIKKATVGNDLQKRKVLGLC